MGRAARTKTSKAAVKHTLKHARSPEGLVVGIEALGLHEACWCAERRRGADSRGRGRHTLKASLVGIEARSTPSRALRRRRGSVATSGLGSGLGGGMDTTHHGRERRPAPAPAPQNPTTLEDEFLEHGVRVVERLGRAAALGRPRRGPRAPRGGGAGRDGRRLPGPARRGLRASWAQMAPCRSTRCCATLQSPRPTTGRSRAQHCVDVAALSPPRPPPPVEIGIAPPARQPSRTCGFAYAARPVEASHVDGDVVRRSVAPHVYLRKLARARAFAAGSGDFGGAVRDGEQRRHAHRRARDGGRGAAPPAAARRAEAVGMASKGGCATRRSSGGSSRCAGRRWSRRPLRARAAFRRRPCARRSQQLDLGRAQAAVLGVAPPATPPPSQRSPDAGRGPRRNCPRGGGAGSTPGRTRGSSRGATTTRRRSRLGGLGKWPLCVSPIGGVGRFQAIERGDG